MTERCGKPIFPLRGFNPTGHCGLTKNHEGLCCLESALSAEQERKATKQLDLDLSEAWKPSRDLPSGETPIGPWCDPLPEGFISDET